MAIKPGPGKFNEIKQGKSKEEPHKRTGSLAHNGMGKLVEVITEKVQKIKKDKKK